MTEERKRDILLGIVNLVRILDLVAEYESLDLDISFPEDDGYRARISVEVPDGE